MNKRQAKIKALWLAGGILQGTDAIAVELLPKDQIKVEAEFDKITNQLLERATRLTATGLEQAYNAGFHDGHKTAYNSSGSQVTAVNWPRSPHNMGRVRMTA